ncbi:hypothetical protein [uncultured Rubinisphaera sp.]|uniref:hypothetical protein n=1 Tax=uncultured Rubinisphaera sp. TaxID=1678686 RepID=UPI0030D73BF1
MIIYGIAILIPMVFVSNLSGDVSHQVIMKSCPAIQLLSKGKPETQIQIQSTTEKTILKIDSSFGIDQAVLKRTGSQWPKSIEVQLHLSGLESFTIRKGEIVLHWSVLSSGQGVICTLKNGDQPERELKMENSLYSEVEIVSKTPQIPLQSGYFKILLPEDFLKGSAETIQLKWIDFYRN